MPDNNIYNYENIIHILHKKKGINKSTNNTYLFRISERILLIRP